MSMNRYIVGVAVIVTLTFSVGQGITYAFNNGKKPPSKEQLERIRKKVETLKMWRLTKSLDLDESTAAKLFPMMNRYDKERLTVERNMRENMRKLRRSVDTAHEKELRDIMKRLNKNHRKLQEINSEEVQRIGKILSARDMAKFMLFKQDFNREMKRRIQKVKEKRRRPLRKKANMPPSPKGAPGDFPGE
jgi:hypothetical protein